jgi:hypothetical protein
MIISTSFRVWHVKGDKPFFVYELHSLMQSMQRYLETYHELQCARSHIGNIANGYLNHQWYLERCEAIKCGILKQIRSVIRKWVKDKQNERVLR